MNDLRHTHDVVIVGARCAGAATAMLLAKLGYDVALVDRTVFPSDTLSTHGISRGGVVQLQRWGLLDALLAAGTRSIRKVTFSSGTDRIDRWVKPSAGVELLIAPRRYLIDALLAEAAQDAGAVLYPGTTVTGLLRHPTGRVCGVQARRTGGAEVSIHARLVIGADGLRSRVAREVGAQAQTELISPSGTFYAYFNGLDAQGFEFHLADRAMAGVFPTSADEACVWLSGPASDSRALRSAGAGKLDALVAQIAEAAPELGRRLRGCQAASGVRGAINLPNVIRRPYGPGWALVGDSGYHRDPITGHGMTDAFRDAELLASAVDRWLGGAEPASVALSGYHRQRDQAIGPIFDLTCALSEFPGVSRFVELQKSLSNALEAEAAWLAEQPELGSTAGLVAA